MLINEPYHELCQLMPEEVLEVKLPPRPSLAFLWGRESNTSAQYSTMISFHLLPFLLEFQPELVFRY